MGCVAESKRGVLDDASFSVLCLTNVGVIGGTYMVNMGRRMAR